MEWNHVDETAKPCSLPNANLSFNRHPLVEDMQVLVDELSPPIFVQAKNYSEAKGEENFQWKTIDHKLAALSFMKRLLKYLEEMIIRNTKKLVSSINNLNSINMLF